MTVCIAAIAENAMVLAASDRMLTAGDIEFQPPRSKIFRLTPSIITMASGDSSLNMEITHSVWRDVYERIEKDPTNWWKLSDVAHLYRYYYDTERVREAESSILVPLGLTAESFISRQDEMSEEFLRTTSNKLLSHTVNDLQVIICGLDSEGPHIYVFDNGEISCRDGVGFAAIGAGEWHASSQLMFAGHTQFSSLATTLLLVYTAKKRAEVAPGVGETTDMFAVGAGLGHSTPVAPEHLEKLQREYLAICSAESKAAESARARTQKYWEKLFARIRKAQLQQATRPESDSLNPGASTEP
jgi:hypothetical protein